MSPRYKEIVIPDRHEGEFEECLKRLDGEFSGKYPSKTELTKTATKMWIEQRSVAIELVHLFQQKWENPTFAFQVDNGFFDLLGDITSVLPRDEGKTRITHDFMYRNSLREKFGFLFESWLPSDLPKDVVLSPGGGLKKRAGSKTRPLPRGIIYTMERYGLTGQPERSMQEIADRHGGTKQAVSQAVRRTLRDLALNHDVRVLLEL